MPRHVLRCRRFWLLCGLGFVLAVVVLSLMRDPPESHRLWGIKLGHLSAYAWLMVWFSQIFRRLPARLLTAVALCALGIGLEYLQGFTGYRTFAYSDMRDNALGIACGFLLGLTPLREGLAMLESMFWRLRR